MSAPTTISLQADHVATPGSTSPAGAQPAASHLADDTHADIAGGADLPTGHSLVSAQSRHAGGDQTSRGQAVLDTHSRSAPAPSSPQAGASAMPNVVPPAGSQTDDGGHWPPAPQSRRAPVVTDQPSGQCAGDTQRTTAGGSEQGQPAIQVSTPTRSPLADPTLALAADILDDLETVRTANQNRLRSLTRDVEDSDGEVRGFGLSEDHPDVARLAALVQMLEKAEHDATLNLKRARRKHPLGPWVKAQRGIGEKQAARLLATIGDPYLNGATGEPRTVSALWAYAGLHVITDPAGGDPGQATPDAQLRYAGVAPRRQKGQRANWSTLAKTRAWLIIAACMKQLDADCKTDTGIADHIDGCACSPYRVVIDERRKHTAVTHPEWTPGHSLNDAMRIASKRLLRDLWREARDIHNRTAN